MKCFVRINARRGEHASLPSLDRFQGSAITQSGRHVRDPDFNNFNEECNIPTHYSVCRINVNENVTMDNKALILYFVAN